jgi:tRNA threonylcarbamoyladenosine biosynthesis protein TsaE
MLYLPPVTTVTRSPEETIAAGRTLAAKLGPGSAVALTGDLGAGKTHFVRGLVEGWGGSEPATSPTFTLVHEYATPRGPIYHLDLYRARDGEEIWAAAHDEMADPHGLLVIEWADRFPAIVPEGAVGVAIRHTGDGQREITLNR